MSTHAGHRRVPLVRIRYRCEAIVTTPERLGCPSVSNPTCVLESAPDTLTALRTRLSANPAHGAGPRLVSAANDGQARSEQAHLVIPRPSRLLIAAVFEEPRVN